MSEISRDIISGARVFLVLSLLTGLAYPFLITEIAQNLMHDKAEGSLISMGGMVVGSELIGQEFISPRYFHSRPSAVGYAADGSGASNLGPTSSSLIEMVDRRVAELRLVDNLSRDAKVPADMALASGSGLDPHISLEAATQQVPRVSKARSLSQAEVQGLVESFVEPPTIGILGQERVNVLKLNLALNQKFRG